MGRYRYLLFYKPYDVLCQFTDGMDPLEQDPGGALDPDRSQQTRHPRGDRPGNWLHRHPQPDRPPPPSPNPPSRRLTLQDYIPVKEVYAVGRLDRDSEGLLLLTNHGPLQHRISHPRFGHSRTYWVQVEGIPDEKALDRLRQGLPIQNYHTLPAQVALLDPPPLVPPRTPPIRFRQHIPTSWLALTLREGRNRQVRRMTAAVGFPTLRLLRVALELHQHHPPLKLTLEGLQPGQWRDLTPAEEALILRQTHCRG